MTIEWNVVLGITSQVGLILVTALITRWFENKAKLISYYGHVESFQITPPGSDKIDVGTHSVVLRNDGREAATNVRLSHNVLPDFKIWPAINYTVQTLPNGTLDIVIPTLVSGEQITIAYLYFAPTTYSQINSGIKCDQGFAKPTPMKLLREYPRWINLLALMVMLVGVVSIIYVSYSCVIRWLSVH